MGAEHVVGSVADFAPGPATIVQVDGREVGIFNVDGRLYGLPNMCPHQNGPLCRGGMNGSMIANDQNELEWAFEGRIVRCPWHFLEFDVTTGRCLANEEWAVRTYTVRVDGERVIVEL